MGVHELGIVELIRRSEFFNDLLVLIGCRRLLVAYGAILAQPRTARHLVHIHAVGVKSAVTPVAEHHLVIVMGCRANAALLALHAFPSVLAYARPVDQVRVELETVRVTVALTRGARDHRLHTSRCLIQTYVAHFVGGEKARR